MITFYEDQLAQGVQLTVERLIHHTLTFCITQGLLSQDCSLQSRWYHCCILMMMMMPPFCNTLSCSVTRLKKKKLSTKTQAELWE